MPKKKDDAAAPKDAAKALKADKAPAKARSPSKSAAVSAPTTMPMAGEAEGRLPTEQELLDEALDETFPASDAISPAKAVKKAGTPADKPKAAKKKAAPGPSEPFHFPTSEDPHPGPQHVEPMSRDDRVRQLAYLKAEARGFEGGSEVEDWLAAEAEIDGTPEGKPQA